MRKIMGYCLIGLVLTTAFGTSFATIAMQSSLIEACGVFAVMGLMMGVLYYGVYLTS